MLSGLVMKGTDPIVLGGRFGNLFDDDLKQWQMFADLISSAGRIFDFSTQLYAVYFLPLASLGNLAQYSESFCCPWKSGRGSCKGGSMGSGCSIAQSWTHPVFHHLIQLWQLHC